MQSERGKPLLVTIDNRRFCFVKNSKDGTRANYRCTKKSKGCKATVTLDVLTNTTTPGKSHHICELPKEGATDATGLMRGLKRKVDDGCLGTTENIILTELKESTTAINQALPPMASINRSLRRWRNQAHGGGETVASEPKLRSDYVVPDQYKVYGPPKEREKFLLYDGIAGASRMLIFGTLRALTLMTVFTNWIADGTFRSCPSLFYQCYSIHHLENSIAIPSLFILLPNKTKAVYFDMFSVLKSLLNVGDDFSPNLMIDFEFSVFSSFTAVFPHAKSNSIHKKYIFKVLNYI